MAVKYAHADIIDGGLSALKTTAIRMMLVKAYSLLDSYATCVGNKVAEATMASGDFVITGADGADRVCTIAAKSATASANSGASPDLHVVFHDNSSKVLLVTDETSNQVVTSGNTVNFPSITFTGKQPT